MDHNLSFFLQKFRDNSDYYTHVSQLKPLSFGNFRIDPYNIEEFWNIYCKSLSTKANNFFSGISERCKEYRPILVDIDLRISYDEDIHGEEKDLIHFYQDHHLKKIIYIFQDIFKYILKNYKDTDLTCFVLEKEKPYLSGNSIIKNGFHLHFPFIFMSIYDQDTHLFSRVKKRVEEEDVFADIGIEHSGDLVDTNVLKKNFAWLIYGGRKDVKLEPYKLTRIYNSKMREIDLELALKDYKLYDSNDEEIKLDDDLEYYLPRILSVQPNARTNVFSVKQNIDCAKKQEFAKVKNSKYIDREFNKPIDEVIEEIKEIMPMLNPRRADNYENWWEVGVVLYNITDGCVEGLDIWIEFSKLTEKDNFDESYCIYAWSRMEKRNITLGSLVFLVQKDNPDVYEAYKREKNKEKFNNILNGGHTDLAAKLFELYGYKENYDRGSKLGSVFVCASYERDIWYEFINHRWHRIEKGCNLRSKISTNLVKICEKGWNDELKFSEERSEDNDIFKKKKDLKNKLLSSLKSASFKDSVMKECREQFFKEEFLSKLDSNIHLLGFEDGVLDLHEMKFREGRPEDFISMSTNYNFLKPGYDYNNWEKMFEPDDLEILQVNDFLVKIFPDPKLREYFMEYAANLLKGGNFDKTFVVMSGEGDNGKSVAIDLIEKALGSYAVKLPTTLLTAKETGSSAATPELDRLHGVRFAVCDEPSSKDTINNGPLKRLTGNDRLYARGLFKEGRDIIPLFKLSLICNKLPRLTSEDQAVWNRVRVLTFESRFPKDSSIVPVDFEEQLRQKIFYRDNSLNEKLPYMKRAFMFMMIQKFRKVKLKGPMETPYKVISATDKYRETNDVFLQFITDCIVEDYDTESHNGITISDCYNLFKDWYKENFPGNKTITRNELRDDLIKKWGCTKNNKWSFYRSRTFEDDVKEGKKLILRDNDFIEDDEKEQKSM